MKEINELSNGAVELLKTLISIPSFSKEEEKTATAIASYFDQYGVQHHRIDKNVFAFNLHFDPSKPTILLNSHHDTVRPNPGYSKDPFTPIVDGGRLYGLGSNDAGGCLVSLLATFLHFYHHQGLKYNLCFAATAEEEISGVCGMELFIKEVQTFHPLGKHPDDFAIIGEPTLMQMAVAEKGLLVLDAVATGKSGHAAREEGVNALYIAVEDIVWISGYGFPKVSPFLGPVKMSVTSIFTENKAHNVVPDTCTFVVDVRINELYTFDEVIDIVATHIKSDIKPRSMRLKSSMIPESHPIVKAGSDMGRQMYGSPTTSDKALVGMPALKIGPGDSARSHTADEYIYLQEITTGIGDYITLIEKIIK
ncbi:MAG: M20 family metallo-hydrolase [Saprospiraceae bacterium]